MLPFLDQGQDLLIQIGHLGHLGAQLVHVGTSGPKFEERFCLGGFRESAAANQAEEECDTSKGEQGEQNQDGCHCVAFGGSLGFTPNFSRACAASALSLAFRFAQLAQAI